MPYVVLRWYTSCSTFKKDTPFTTTTKTTKTKNKTHTMPHSTRISLIHALAISVKNGIQKKTAYIKAVVTNETTQKILLFAAIICLLLLAANLDNLL